MHSFSLLLFVIKLFSHTNIFKIKLLTTFFKKNIETKDGCNFDKIIKFVRISLGLQIRASNNDNKKIYEIVNQRR